jgi:hypothetical protein
MRETMTIALIAAVGTMLLGGTTTAAESEVRAGTVVGGFTAGGKKTALKYAYVRWEKALIDSTVGIAVVLTERPASPATLVALGKAEYLIRPMDTSEVGALMQFNFAPDGKVKNYQSSRTGWSNGDLGGQASKFVLTGGKLHGEVAGHPNGWEYTISFDVPLGSRPPELK